MTVILDIVDFLEFFSNTTIGNWMFLSSGVRSVGVVTVRLSLSVGPRNLSSLRPDGNSFQNVVLKKLGDG
jgi:hypothetical protein